jgi:hypothetical protein
MPKVTPGFAPVAGPLAPEIGYFFVVHLLLSLQLRRTR